MIRSHRVMVLCLTAALAIASPAGAQELFTPDLIVEGTKTGTPIEQMTGAVTVIDEATIQALRVPTVAEVLRQVEGLDVVQSGGPGGQTSLFLRGGNSNHVLVLIDGVKVNNPTTGRFDAAHLTVDQIERIEVLRGSQSPLYGSEALAGVVNIITKKGREGANDQVTIEGGAYRTWRATAVHSDRGPIWDENLSVSRWTSRGFSRANERLGNTEPDGYSNTTFAARLGRGAGVGGRLDVSLRLTDGTTDFDDAFPFADSAATSRDKAAVAGVTLSAPITPWWDHRLVVGWSRNHRTSERSSFDSDTDAQSRQVEWRHTVSSGPDNLLTVGYEHLNHLGRYVDAFSSYDQRVVTNAVYVQDQLAAFEPLFFTAGLRSDGHNRFGRHNTYKIGSSLALERWRTRLFTNYGTGFRAPTLDDLYFPGFSNPALQPETSKGYEAGLEHTLVARHFTIGATYFRTAYNELIVFEGFTPVNRKTAEATGVEVSSRWVVDPRATIQGTYTYTGTRDGSTNDQLARRPRNKANLALVFQPDQDSDLRVDYRYVGERLDSVFTGLTTPSYSLVNLAASRRWNPNVTFFTRVDNLFDRDYEEVMGYGTAGRSLYAGLTASF